MGSLIILACFLYFKSTFGAILDEKTGVEVLNSSKEFKDDQPQSTAPEVSIQPCPPNKSLHTKEDINIMIDYRIKTLAIYESINNSYYSRAVAVRDKHMNHFDNFCSWYQDRPEHLKHNIEDIAFLRSHIEPFIKPIAKALNQYPHLQELYDIKLNRTNSLKEKLNRYKIICENNCESKGTFRISRRSDYNGYYCSSVRDLDETIQAELLDFSKSLSSSMVDRIIHDDKEFAKKFEDLKNKIKDVALKEFGRNMYDILSLQDEYHHFIEDLKSVDANLEVYTIKETNLQIDTKLLELEKRLDSYGSYCRSCNEISFRSLPVKMTVPPNEEEERKTKGLVNYLLNLKFIEIKKSINDDYIYIFGELNSTINNSEELYLINLKPIQDEVIELLKQQRTNFDDLKSIANPSAVKKLVKLLDDSKELLTNINTEIDYINEVLPK